MWQFSVQEFASNSDCAFVFLFPECAVFYYIIIRNIFVRQYVLLYASFYLIKYFLPVPLMLMGHGTLGTK